MIRALCLASLLAAVAAAVESKPVTILEVTSGDSLRVRGDFDQEDGETVVVHLLYACAPDADDMPKDAGAARAALDAWCALHPEGLQQAVEAGRAERREVGFTLWQPADELIRSPDGSIWALLIQRYVEPRREVESVPGAQSKRVVDRSVTHVITAQEYLIAHGWSAYMRDLGDAPEPYHALFLAAQARAQESKAGAWATAEGWLRAKSAERLAPPVPAVEPKTDKP